jgi:hypothetical protein
VTGENEGRTVRNYTCNSSENSRAAPGPPSNTMKLNRNKEDKVMGTDRGGHAVSRVGMRPLHC